MKVEKQEHGIVLVPESEFEREALIELKRNVIKGMQFEDAWEQKGRFIISFDTDWGL